MLAERPAKGKKKETALLGPGSVLDAAAYLSSTRSRASMRAATSCRLAAFGAHELEALLVSPIFSHEAFRRVRRQQATAVVIHVRLLVSTLLKLQVALRVRQGAWQMSTNKGQASLRCMQVRSGVLTSVWDA